MDVTDEKIRHIFRDASDFETRTLRHGSLTLHAYFIDGLVSGGFVSDYIFKPVRYLPENVEEAYRLALAGGIYNAVAKPCKDADDIARKLVNGFCVLLFPGVGAIAFLSKKSYAWTLFQFERKQAKEMEKVILKWKIYEF